jgi:hypothetical protein
MDLLFHIDEVPVAELLFYARKLSIIYVALFIITVIETFLIDDRSILPWSIASCFLLLLNVATLRFVCDDQSLFRIRCSLSVACMLLTYWIIWVVWFGVKGYFSPIWNICGPIVAVLMQATTAFILNKFRQKIIVMAAVEENPLRSSLIDPYKISYDNVTPNH